MADNTQREEMILKLGTKGDDAANVVSVAATMNGIDALLREIHNACDKNHDFLLKARPFKKGSFDIPLELVVVGVATLNWPVIRDMVSIFAEYLKLKKLLRGQEPRFEGQSIIIRDSTIQVENMTLNLLREHSTGTRAMSDAFHTLENDPDVSGLAILQPAKTRPLLRVKRTEFPYYREATPSQSISIRKTNTSREILVVASPVLESTPKAQRWKWRFAWKGIYIRARIVDPTFLDTVKTGEPFSNGDRLEADLTITQEYDKLRDDYLNVDYTVTRIWRHIPRPRQGRLFNQ
jgi:hypothetical protein